MFTLLLMRLRSVSLCFRPHVADLYVGHRSGVLQVEIHRTRSVKKRSAHGPTLPAIKKNSACMFLKMQMVCL